MNIEVPKPTMSIKGKADLATEIAFNKLIQVAQDHGLPVQPVMGMMYLPDQEVTRQFQQACRDVLICLGVSELKEDG